MGTPSRVIQGYRVLAMLGKGTYGVVHKVQKDDQFFALKEQSYLASVLIPPDCLREAIVTMTARHPNIVRAHKVIVDPLDYKIYTVFDLGTLTLTQWLRTNPPVVEKVAVLFQILCGLEFLHKARIIHGDLKPDNILLFKDGTVKLADFGFAARNMGQDLSLNVQTILWRAPEVLDRSSYNSKIDMWSLGVIMYQMFSGKYPFVSTEANTLMHEQRLLQARLNISGQPNLSMLIRWCLELNPTKRITAMEALQLDTFRGWNRPVGRWKEANLVKSLTDLTLLRQLVLIDGSIVAETLRLACDLVQRCSIHDRTTITACCTLATILLQNTTPATVVVSPVLRQSVLKVCDELQYRFYSGLG
jgi:serine/threonine protein kinase